MLPLITNLTGLGYPSQLITENVLPSFHPLDAHETLVLLRQGELADKLCFICKGMGRIYYHVDGKRGVNGRRKQIEVNRSVAEAGEWLTVPHEFLGQAVSTVCIELLGPSRAYYITYADFERLVKTDEEFGKVAQCIWTILFEQCFEREDLMRIYPSEKRFNALEERYKQLESYLPNRSSWASLAGVSPSTLKRYLSKRVP